MPLNKGCAQQLSTYTNLSEQRKRNANAKRTIACKQLAVCCGLVVVCSASGLRSVYARLGRVARFQHHTYNVARLLCWASCQTVSSLQIQLRYRTSVAVEMGVLSRF